MRVSNRFLYYQLVKDLNQNTEKLFRLNNQISSGKRIDTPSEDPIGMSSVLIYRTELNAYTQYKKSIDYGNGWLNQMDSILQDTDDLLARASELAVQAASSTSTEETRLGAAEEIEEIRAMILSNANTKYGNKYIFGGTMTQNAPFLWVDAEQWLGNGSTMADTAPAAPADGDMYIDTDDGHVYQYDATSTSWVDQGVPAEGDSLYVEDSDTLYVYTDGEWQSVYQGNDSTFSMQIGKENSAEINIPGSEIFTNQQGDVFMTLLRLESALRSNDADAVSDELSSIEDAATIISNNLAKVGATVNKLEHTLSVIERSEVDTQEMVSTIEDLDYAEAITSLKNQQTIYEAALQSASMITSLSLVDFI
ncbi:MAG TPA: flagellar hook-associated protein FlgL [Deltaproteobacteria bacterium]|mgnify:CR=1 FL=1|nr:flagellar hook-associated protein FlgL [Deltaproteobacteria bacterium]HPR55502.1 flagellar hook-associated protein FlgL [Deltaproteobacteria bacterium]HXK48625.1 flagellar hook-associated protein FlgL [Deltaproteobacteria bacterium]